MDNTSVSLGKLVNKAKKHLDLLDYAEGTKCHYALIWKHFLKYAKQKGCRHFSKEFGWAFLEDNYKIKPGMRLSPSQVFKVRTITVLGEMQEYNYFLKCHQKPGKLAPQQFQNVISKYEKFQTEKRLSKETINGKRIVLVRFLNYLDEQGITDIAVLTPQKILFYLHTLEEYRPATISGILFVLRNFLSFLYSEGNIKEPLNKLFPVIFTNKHDRIPSYYSTNEIHAILCQVDRDTEFGRRDYLILLLAVQFGIRAGDIRQLKFKDVKWSRNTIEFIQQKTKKPHQLPLTEEFKYSLADYMKNSRPKVDNPHIFVRHRAPFQPFIESNSFYHVTNKYMALAGIELHNRKRGLHSMRHSAASNLLIGHTPYPVISGILGHGNISTTKFYLRIDIQQLRTVALEVPNER